MEKPELPSKPKPPGLSFTVDVKGLGRKVTEGDQRFVSEEDERNGRT